MNLHGIVASAIGVVNPMVWVTIQVSAGNVTQADGTQVPVYRRAVRRLGQIQPMSNRDLRQMEGVNLQGSPQSLYIQGNVDGLVRVEGKGGDLVITEDGKTWLVVQPLENWPDWCKVVVTLQNQIEGS